jgi:DNA-binding beta-propeller fold protein YncE
MRKHVQHFHTGLVAVASLVLVAHAGTSARPFPDLIPLPADFGPEGIAVGNGTTFYAGSLAASTRGQILVGDLRTGETATLVLADGVPATGMKHDPRSNLLFVARAASGMGTVFDAASGAVVTSREAAYFTDTQAPFLYKVELGPAGLPSADADSIPLPGTFRTNGIVATPDGEHLLVVDAASAQLYRVDTATHTAHPSELGGSDGDQLIDSILE